MWNKHPNQNNLTEKLELGTSLMYQGRYDYALKVFTNIINSDPKWSEAWNKRATLLFLMKDYQKSLDDISIVLDLEPRHFGALSGQALNYIELKKYELAIESYKSAQKIFPLLDSAKKMIPELQELINDQAI